MKQPTLAAVLGLLVVLVSMRVSHAELSAPAVPIATEKESTRTVDQTVPSGKQSTSVTHKVPPPKHAIVLFNGSNLDAWSSQKSKAWEDAEGPAKWKIVSGDALEVVPGAGSIITKQRFGDCHLHLEFRVLGEKTNGGVYLLARYELNINDSYGNPEGSQCGVFSNLADKIAPRRSEAAPPMQWQTLDVDFQSPRFDNQKNLIEQARATVELNGSVIYENVELGKRKGAAKRLGDAPNGPLMLQEHGTAYQFRNIWIVDKSK